MGYVEMASIAVLVGTMHLAKGLEFRAVAVMACDQGVLPLEERVADVADEFNWTRSSRPSGNFSTSQPPEREIACGFQALKLRRSS